MELWNQLADTTPNTTMALVLGLVVALVVAAIVASLSRDQFRGGLGPTFGLFVGAMFGVIFGVGMYVFQDYRASNDATDAIEQYLVHTHDLRVLDPIDLDLVERTAVAETVNEDGKRVTATIEWIDLETKTAFLGEDFEPLTVKLTKR